MGEILFFAVVAGVIGYKLYVALGHEDYKPQAKQQPPQPAVAKGMRDVTPEKKSEQTVAPTSPLLEEEEKALAAAGPVFAKDIEAIKKIDAKFSLAHFLSGASKAFEMILKAFSAGDRATLAKLLSPSIYRSFEAAILEREKNQQKLETTLLAEPVITLKRITLQSSEIRITLGIQSEQVNLTKDVEGKLQEGNPSQTEYVYDEWTFAKDSRVSDPNWMLVSTRAL